MKKLLIFIITCLLFIGCNNDKTLIILNNGVQKISVPNIADALWQFELLKTGRSFMFHPPEFEIEGKLVSSKLISVLLKN